MVLSIEIPAQTADRLRRQAAAAGQDVGSYVTQIVEQATAKSSLDEVLAPLGEQFAATGIGNAELLRDITEAQAEHRAEKRKRPA
jgi:hypothetical protein